MTLLGLCTNEAGVTTDWTFVNANGTITESTSFYRVGKGNQSLRNNKTGATTTDNYADQRYIGANLPRTCSGAFWLYVAALPGAANEIFNVHFATADDLNITIDQLGDIRLKEQHQASYGPVGRCPVGSSCMLEWQVNATANPHVMQLRMNGSGYATYTAVFAAENPTNVRYGQNSGVGTSTFDLYYDDCWIFDDNAWHGLPVWQPVGNAQVGPGLVTGTTMVTDDNRSPGFIA
jgi:hypothetical protein